jgi:hypothetical protein
MRYILLGISFISFDVYAQTTLSPIASIPAPAESKLIKGTQSSDPTDNAPDPNGGIVNEDVIGSLALATLLDSVNWYQSEGIYNDSDWKVERSVLSGSNLDVFTIYESARKATKFSSSKHGLFYQFTTKEDHVVYALLGNTFSQVATIKANQISVGSFTRLGTLIAEDVKGKRSFVIAPAKMRVSLFSDLGSGVEGASLGKSPIGEVSELHYPITGKPFDTWLDYQGAPGSWENNYTWNRQLFWVQNASQPGLVWQSKDDGQLYATWFSQDLYQAKTVKLPTESGMLLAAAASDASGNLYYLLVQSGDGMPNDTRSVTLLKTDATGKELKRSNPDASVEGMNITFFGSLGSESNIGSMQVSNGEVALIIGRRMHRGADGLNHQGAIAVIFDASTLQTKKNLGQTSGHSFSNLLTLDQKGGFVGLDLGDNYPRGLNLHRISNTGLLSNVVYTFKTEHSTDCRPNAKNVCRFGVFSEASSDKTTYYKWSNDNATYTELGGLVESPNGWVVAFAGERSILDVTLAGSPIKEARDIGVLVVRKDFEKQPATTETNVVSDTLVISTGETAKGGFYDFGGRWNPQRSTGVNWLTSYPSDATRHASRVKTASLPNGDILILWEEWSTSAYLETKGMTIQTELNKDKKVSIKTVQSPFSLGSTFRLNPRDEVIVRDGKLLVATSDAGSRQLVLRTITLPQ